MGKRQKHSQFANTFNGSFYLAQTHIYIKLLSATIAQSTGGTRLKCKMHLSAISAMKGETPLHTHTNDANAHEMKVIWYMVWCGINKRMQDLDMLHHVSTVLVLGIGG